MARFVDAVRFWAETTGNKYKIPRKGTAEYVEIMGFLDELKKVEAHDAGAKKASKMSAPRASAAAPAPAPAPAPKMSKADKALARAEAKFQEGRARAIAKDKAEAMAPARASAVAPAPAPAPAPKKMRKIRIVEDEDFFAPARASAAAPAPAPAPAPVGGAGAESISELFSDVVAEAEVLSSKNDFDGPIPRSKKTAYYIAHKRDIRPALQKLVPAINVPEDKIKQTIDDYSEVMLKTLMDAPLGSHLRVFKGPRNIIVDLETTKSLAAREKKIRKTMKREMRGGIEGMIEQLKAEDPKSYKAFMRMFGGKREK